jgi:lipoprotein-releasing system permease protein
VDSGREQAFITIKGVDPELEPTVTDVGRSMQQGSISALAQRSGDLPDGIVIGRDLASQLSVSVGDDVSVLTPEGTLSPMGMIPRSRRFRVVGIFRLGLYEFDSAYGYVNIDVARRLLNRDTPDYIEARVDDMYAAPRLAQEIEAQLGDAYITQDWADMNQSLFSALWLEKMAISITIGLIVMVAALNIVASLVLLVMEKNRDIAILKTMGSSMGSIRTIFMLQGLLIGLVGTAVGAGLGLGTAYVLDRYQLIRVPIDVYQISHVPFVVEGRDLAIVLVAAVLICFLATIYPSRQAAKLDPAQALRYS